MSQSARAASVKASVRIEDVIQRAQVRLHRSGQRRMVGLCPFHQEHRPSFTVYLDTQSFYCFGCGIAGDVITFMQLLHGGPQQCSFVEACDLLGVAPVSTRQRIIPAPRLPVETPETALRHAGRAVVMSCAAAIYAATLERSASVQAYLRGRGISLDLARRVGLGYADGMTFPRVVASSPALLARAKEWGLLNRRGRDLLVRRLVIPEWREGRVVQMIGRVVPAAQTPLSSIIYLGTTRFKGVLGYGCAIERLVQGTARGILVVEGGVDYTIASGWDLPVVPVALNSTGASPYQVQELATLQRYTPTQPLLIALDGDRPGQEATPYLLRALQAAQVPAIAVPPIPGAIDIGELGPLGARGRHRLLSVVQPLLEEGI